MSTARERRALFEAEERDRPTAAEPTGATEPEPAARYVLVRIGLTPARRGPATGLGSSRSAVVMAVRRRSRSRASRSVAPEAANPRTAQVITFGAERFWNCFGLTVEPAVNCRAQSTALGTRSSA